MSTQPNFPLAIDTTTTWGGHYQGKQQELYWDGANHRPVVATYTEDLYVRPVAGSTGFYTVTAVDHGAEQNFLAFATSGSQGNHVLSTASTSTNALQDYVPVLSGNNVTGFVKVGLQANRGGNAQFGTYQLVSNTVPAATTPAKPVVAAQPASPLPASPLPVTPPMSPMVGGATSAVQTSQRRGSTVHKSSRQHGRQERHESHTRQTTSRHSRHHNAHADMSEDGTQPFYVTSTGRGAANRDGQFDVRTDTYKL